MKVNEIMVDDIVAYLDDETLVPVVVKKIDGPSNIVCLKQTNGHTFNTTIEFLKPIAITPEILELSGFERYNQGGDCIVMWTGYGEDGKDDLSVEFNVYSGERTIKTKFDIVGSYYVSDIIKYVHQLQHAFSICEINKQITLP